MSESDRWRLSIRSYDAEGTASTVAGYLRQGAEVMVLRDGEGWAIHIAHPESDDD